MENDYFINIINTVGVLVSSFTFIRIFPILIERQQSRNPFSIASPTK